MRVRFDWDDAKDRVNQAKHAIGFREASELFSSGVDYLEIFDAEHSYAEARFIAIGRIRRGLVLIVWTERDDETIRIISARWAEPAEQVLYDSYAERLI